MTARQRFIVALAATCFALAVVGLRPSLPVAIAYAALAVFGAYFVDDIDMLIHGGDSIVGRMFDAIARRFER